MKIKQFLRNSFYTISSNLLSLIISVIVTLIVPKVVGVYQYGYWQLYVFFTAYVGVFPLGWIDGIYLRYGGERYENLNKVMMHSQFFVYCFSQIIIAFTIIMVSGFLNLGADKAIVIKLCAVCLIFYNIRAFILILLQATNRISKYSTVTIEDRLIYVLLLVCLLLLGFRSFVILVIADLIAKFITTLHAIYICKDITLVNNSRFTFSLAETRESIRVGIKLLVANFAGLLIIGVIRYAIQKYWNVVTFGKISLTLSISSLVVTFVSAISLVLFPALRRIDKSNLNRIYSLFRDAIILVLGASLFVYFPLKWLLPIWLPQYQSGLIFMAVLFPVCFFEGKFELLTNTFMKTLRMEKTLLNINLGTLLLSVVFAFANAMTIHNLNIMVFTIVIVLGFRSTLGEYILSKELQVQFKSDAVLELFIAVGFIIAAWFFSVLVSFLMFICIFLVAVLVKRKSVIVFLVKSKEIIGG